MEEFSDGGSTPPASTKMHQGEPCKGFAFGVSYIRMAVLYVIQDSQVVSRILRKLVCRLWNE